MGARDVDTARHRATANTRDAMAETRDLMADKAELLALMERYNRIGLLLPRDEHAIDDPHVRTSVELILAEMAQVRTEIFAFIAAVRANG
jgi:hypothetical protein